MTQQTLQQAIRKLDSFRGGNLRAWLFCIARHSIASRARVWARAQFTEFDETQHGAQALQTTPDSVQATCDARSRIQRCLDCMATRLRRAEEVAVLLADVHGCADHESSGRMRMTLASFKFLLHRARGRLHGVASTEQPGNPCPLVSKTGARRACPAGATASATTAACCSLICAIITA